MSEAVPWMYQYEALWLKISSCVEGSVALFPHALRGEYINPKLVIWNDVVKTRFINASTLPYGDWFRATGILKIGSVYQQGFNFYPQVSLRECKCYAIESIFKSLLSDSEDEDGLSWPA